MGLFSFAHDVSLTLKEQEYVKPHLEFVIQEDINLKNNKIAFSSHFLKVLKKSEESDLFTISNSINGNKLKVAKYINFEEAVGRSSFKFKD